MNYPNHQHPVSDLSNAKSVGKELLVADTENDALNVVLPSQTGNSGKYLQTNGTDSSWGAVAVGGGTVTSVSITPPAAGITQSGSPITASGSITLALADDLAALEGLGSTGYAKRTGTSAWSTVSTIPASDISSGAALTKVDDTNVTLTLGGTPTTSLLAATSLTLGWTGSLAATRGGTGNSSWTNNGVLYANSTTSLTNSSLLTWDGSTQTVTGKIVNTTSSDAVALASMFKIQNTSSSVDKLLLISVGGAAVGSYPFTAASRVVTLAASGDNSMALAIASGNTETARFSTNQNLLIGTTTDLSGAGGISATGTIKFSGLTASRWIKTDASSQLTTALITAADVTAGAALTKTDDTNVTLTLGGSASSSLIAAASLTLGWTGSLAVTRGGTGLSACLIGDLIYGSASNVFSILNIGSSGQVLTVSGGIPAWSTLPGTGTVTSVSITPPAAGITQSGSPITSSGSITLSLADDLAALEDLSSTGYAKRTGTSAWSVSNTIPYSDLTGTPSSLPPSGSASGDLTGTYPSPTIATSAVTLAKMANLTTQTFIGRNTAGTGVPEQISISTARTMLSISNVENTALTTWAGSTSLVTLGTVTTGTWNGTAIGPTRGGTGLTSATTGDLIYASTSNVWSKLAIGSNGQILTIASGIPAWSSSGAVTSVTASSPIASSGGSTPNITLGTVNPGNGGTGITSYSNGDILYATGSATLSKLPVGSSGTLLIINGSSLPEYRVLSASDIPSLDTTKLTSGTLGVSRGGTGSATFSAGIVYSAGSTTALSTFSGTSGTLPKWSSGILADSLLSESSTRISQAGVTYELRPTTAYSSSPVGLLDFNGAYTSGASYSTMARITMGKENSTDGNNAGYWSISTRTNGGSNDERVRVSSTGAVTISQLTASKFIKTDGSKVLTSSDVSYSDLTGSPVTASSNETYITGDGDYTLSNSWTAVDLGTNYIDVTVSTAGTYIVTCECLLSATSSFNCGLRFYNVTESSVVTNSTRIFGTIAGNYTAASLSTKVVTVSSATIRLYGIFYGSGSGSEPKVINSFSAGSTYDAPAYMRYVRIA